LRDWHVDFLDRFAVVAIAVVDDLAFRVAQRAHRARPGFRVERIDLRGLDDAELLDSFGGGAVLIHPAFDGGLDGAECAADLGGDCSERSIFEALGDDLLVAYNSAQDLARVTRLAALMAPRRAPRRPRPRWVV
jgi:hypothetical protein